MSRFLSSLRFRLILIGILALLPSLGLVLLFSAQLREYAAEYAKDDALRLVNLAASNQDALIDGARQTLITLARVPVVRDTQSGNCDAFLAKLLTHYPSFSNFVVAMPNGDVVCSGLPRTQPVNLADRPYFQRVLQTGDFAVSEYLIARGLGKAIITLAYPVLGDAGQLKGILVVGLDLEWMNKLAELAELPPGSSLTLIDRNGTILTRYPEHEKYVGKTFAEAPIVKTILDNKREGTTQTLGVDGIERMYAFRPLGNTSDPVAYIFIGVPTAVVFANADHVTNTTLIGLIVVTALALTAIWIGSDVLLLRRVNVLVNVTQRLAAGELSARTDVRGGVGELSQLERAFDGMADSLQQRESERKQAEEALRHSHNLLDLTGQIAKVGGWDLNLETQTLTWTEEVYRIHEVDPATRPNVAEAINFYTPESQPVISAAVQAGIDSGTPWDLELQMITAKGRRIWVHAQGVAERHNGKTVRLYGAFQDITERKRAEERIQTQVQRLAALRAIDTAIIGSIDLRLTLNVVVQQAEVQLGVDAVAVLLLNPHTQTLTYAAGCGFCGKAIEHSRLRLGEGSAGRAALERHTISIHNIRETTTDFTRLDVLAGEDFVCYHAAPLIAKGQVQGILELFMRSHRDTDEDWIEFFEMLTQQAAIALDSAQLFEDLQRSNVDLSLAYNATLEGWAYALDLRDKETEGHSQRVTEMTVNIAREMKISEEEQVHMRRGALLHDIGKMGVPDGILLKPGSLTDEEWVVMKKHPDFAYEMLSPIQYLKAALDIPYCHHEKWDGTGYPRGLTGEQIPLAARIFAVVDVWDALISDRPYRKAWTKEKALEHIKAGLGSHFDPQVVEVFLKIIES